MVSHIAHGSLVSFDLQQNDMMDKIADIAYSMPINLALHGKVILAQHESKYSEYMRIVTNSSFCHFHKTCSM